MSLTDTMETMPSDHTVCPDVDMCYLALMQLLPRGTAWDTVDDLHIVSSRGTIIRKFVYALAKNWYLLEQDMCNALNEWFCFTASVDMDLWYKDYGIPDECDIYNANVCAKVSFTGSPTAEFLVQMLGANGYSGRNARWLKGDDPEFPGVFSTFYVEIEVETSPALLSTTFLPFELGLNPRLGKGDLDSVRCMLERYVPAHCAIMVEETEVEPPEWTPEALGPALLGWWDAEKSEQFAIVAPDRVSMWTDDVGSYNPAQSNVGARPQLSPTGFNGRPTVLFEGINYHLTLDSVPFPTGSAPCEIWALCDQTALPTDTIVRLVFAYGDVSNTARRIGRYVSGGVNRARAYVGTGVSQITASDATVDLTGRHILRGRFEAAQTGISVDGGPMTFAAAVPATAAVRTRIGSNDGVTSGLRWQGSIPVIIITSLLTPEQATELHEWLSARLSPP